jgi:hypothetical protein
MVYTREIIRAKLVASYQHDLSPRILLLDCLNKVLIVSTSGGVVALSIAIVAFLVSIPTQDYALLIDPVLTKGGGSIDTHVTIKNIGRQPITNVRVDYGVQTKPDLISILNPGERIELSPPQGSDLNVIKVTADDGIDIVQPYRTPMSAPMIGNGGFSQ